MRIYLIGFMAVGKSSMGQHVADLLNVTFMDTDTMIESETATSIAGIFDLQGEHQFREIEAEVIRQTTIYDKALIATGGGLPCHHDNMAWMNDHGITMYLSWPEDVLIQHVLNQKSSRPLLSELDATQAREKIELLLSERKPFYEMAAMTLQLKGIFENDLLLLEKACKYIW